MLTFYGSNCQGALATIGEPGLPAGPDIKLPSEASRAVWIDACDPNDDELKLLEQSIGVQVPRRDALVEIESSSRLSTLGSTVLLSLPLVVIDSSHYPRSSPVGFLINADKVATIRFDRLVAFDTYARRICDSGALPQGGFAVAVCLLEQIVERHADRLELMGNDLDRLSKSIFAKPSQNHPARRPRDANEALTALLHEVGRSGDTISKISETLLSLSRIPSYLAPRLPDQVKGELNGRIETIGTDTRSLREFEEHLLNKIQFLLDALLGLTNIEQNNVFRVLTVVSVVGIPPTFFASMYGMNFKNMPEYDWAYGYPYGLTLILLSALVPAIWFKVRGWW
jgi:magnesium transporter